MKKHILVMVVVSACIILVIIGYRSFTDEYRPEVKRQHYRELTKAASSKLRKRFVPRDFKHPEVPDDEPEVVEDFQRDIFFDKLEQYQVQKAKCIARLEELFPRDRIIDPEDEQFVFSQNLMDKLRDMADNFMPSVESQGFSESLATYFESREKIKSYDFYKHIKDSGPCLSSSMSMYIETLFEAAQNQKWSEQEFAAIHQIIIPRLFSLVDLKPAPETFIYALNILRAAGTATYGLEYLEELEGVYEKVSEYEDAFFRDIERTKVTEAPSEAYDAYLIEMDLIADEIKYIMTQRYFNALNAN